MYGAPTAMHHLQLSCSFQPTILYMFIVAGGRNKVIQFCTVIHWFYFSQCTDAAPPTHMPRTSIFLETLLLVLLLSPHGAVICSCANNWTLHSFKKWKENAGTAGVIFFTSAVGSGKPFFVDINTGAFSIDRVYFFACLYTVSAVDLVCTL